MRTTGGHTFTLGTRSDLRFAGFENSHSIRSARAPPRWSRRLRRMACKRPLCVTRDAASLCTW